MLKNKKYCTRFYTTIIVYYIPHIAENHSSYKIEGSVVFTFSCCCCTRRYRLISSHIGGMIYHFDQHSGKRCVFDSGKGHIMSFVGRLRKSWNTSLIIVVSGTEIPVLRSTRSKFTTLVSDLRVGLFLLNITLRQEKI